MLVPTLFSFWLPCLPLSGRPAARKSMRIRKKLHHRYTPIVFSFYMAAIMAFLMCATIVALNSELDAGYWRRVLKAYLVSMPVAFCCVLMVRPLVLKLVALTVELPRQ